MKKIFLLAIAVATVASVSAEGYQVNTLSAKQFGMGHTGVSQKLDSESVWFNPAAAAYQEKKFSVSAGVTGIMATATHESINDYNGATVKSTSDNDWSTPLYLYANYKVNENLAVGLSFNTPYGSSMNWGDNWAGAHLVQNISLQAYSAQPTVSYKFLDGKLSVGAGLMMSWGSFELSRSMFEIGDTTNNTVAGLYLLGVGAAMGYDYTTADAATQAAIYTAASAGMAEIASTGDAALASATLSGDAGLKLGVNVGIMYDICEKWSIGASYRSKMMMAVDSGKAELSYANDSAEAALASSFAFMTEGTFSAELPLPSTLSFGASFRPTDRWELAAEFQWVQWSAYENLDVVFHNEALADQSVYADKNYSNTMISRVGAQYEAYEWLTGRLGFYVDESPVASDYLNPETPSMTKVGYTAGVTLTPCSDWSNFSIDLSYGYITSADPERMGAYPYDNSLTGLTETFAGNYTTKAHTAAVGLNWGF